MRDARRIRTRALKLDPNTSARLGRVRQHGTRPELQARQLLAELGLRYTTRNRDLPGSPDLANRTRGWAIFVHGCFWHAHPACPRATVPKRNRAFWLAKFAANKARDAKAIASLAALGFRAVVLWECELARTDAVRRRLQRALITRPRGLT